MGEGWIKSGDPVAPKTICGRSPTHHLLGTWHTPFYKAVEKWGVPRAILVCRVGGLLTYANTKYLQHDIPFWCVVLEVNRHTPTQYTSNTTYHCYVVLEVYWHTPTQNTSNATYHFGVSCWRLTDIRQHNIPPTRHTILVCRVGGLPTYANTKYLQHDIPLVCRVCSYLSTIVERWLQYVGKPPTTHVGGVKWYVVLEVFCVVYVGKPPTTHVGGVKWYVVLEVFCVVYVGKPANTTCWRCKMECHVGGLPTYTVCVVLSSPTGYHVNWECYWSFEDTQCVIGLLRIHNALLVLYNISIYGLAGPLK